MMCEEMIFEYWIFYDSKTICKKKVSAPRTHRKWKEDILYRRN